MNQLKFLWYILGLKNHQNLSDMWVYGDLEQKRKLQRMVFPDGIEYDHENDIYRTFRTNAIFDVIRSFSERSERNKKKPEIFKIN